jgi:hypothetical protein
LWVGRKGHQSPSQILAVNLTWRHPGLLPLVGMVSLYLLQNL